MNQIIPHSKPTLDKSDLSIVSKVLASSFIAKGKKVAEFEHKFARFHNTKFAVATNSGTSALHLALLSLGITKADEVVIPSYVCTALLNAVLYTGAKPVVADVNYSDGNISPESVKRKITQKTKCIIVPHMFGKPADLKALLSFKIPIIEDCAQSIGAKYQGKKVGTFGLLSIFSFYATKVLTTGEGGMIISNNKKLMKKIRDLHDYDNKSSYTMRFNYKMNDIQAALGLSQLSKLPTFIKKRRRIASMYDHALKSIDAQLPVKNKNEDPIYFRYVLKVKNKNKIIQTLNNRKIQCRTPVYKPIHQYLKTSHLPNTDKLYRESVSFPIYPSLMNKEIYYIVKSMKNFYNS